MGWDTVKKNKTFLRHLRKVRFFVFATKRIRFENVCRRLQRARKGHALRLQDVLATFQKRNEDQGLGFVTSSRRDEDQNLLLGFFSYCEYLKL